MAYVSINTPARVGLFASLRGLLARTGAALVQYVRYQQTVRALNALKDRQLEDIGVPRGQIHQTAHLHAYQG